MCCLMRHVETDWRVSGIAYGKGPNQPWTLSDFETGQTMTIARQPTPGVTGQPAPATPGRPSPRTAAEPAPQRPFDNALDDADVGLPMVAQRPSCSLKRRNQSIYSAIATRQRNDPDY